MSHRRRQSADHSESRLPVQSRPAACLHEGHRRLLHEGRRRGEGERGTEREGHKLLEAEVPAGKADDEVREADDGDPTRPSLELQAEPAAGDALQVGNRSSVQVARRRRRRRRRGVFEEFIFGQENSHEGMQNRSRHTDTRSKS